MDCARPYSARHADPEGANLHFRATREGDDLSDCARARRNGEKNAPARKVDWVERNQTDYSFVSKFVADTINRQNVLRLTGFDFDLTTDILDVGINRTFIRFECNAMDRI
jgi:hypothetical protein